MYEIITKAKRKARETKDNLLSSQNTYHRLNENDQYIAIEDSQYDFVGENDTETIQKHNEKYREIFNEDPPRTSYGPIVVLKKT